MEPNDSKKYEYIRFRADDLYLTGKYDQAMADYDELIRLNPKSSDGFYGRGLAKLKNGDAAGGNADIAAAKLLYPTIAEVLAKDGIEP